MKQVDRVWVIDDDRSIRWVLEKALEQEGIAAEVFESGNRALSRLGSEIPDAIISDIRMPGIDGLELLERLHSDRPELPVIIMTAHSDLDSAVSSYQSGAFEYLPKPFDVDDAVAVVKRAVAHAREQRAAISEPVAETAPPAEIIGQAPAMQEVFRAIGRLSNSNITVLINGQSGTGKELVARALHRHSPRAAAPFIALNMAAIPHELIESELFGHEKGAFTGAAAQRLGRFEQADGGTLFLDEIGDMPLPAQAKVLRALEMREVTRVGGNAPIEVDIRVVAATNADLASAVEEKTFRTDLLYRLNVLPIALPPLRERVEDIAPLAEHFLEEIGRRTGRRAPTLEAEALALLEEQPFPGNVRQLRNVLEAANVFAEESITREALARILENGPALATPAPVGASDTEETFHAETFEEFKNLSEALFFRRKLEENNGNVKRTSERLGMQRSHLYKKLDRYGLK